MLNGLIRLVSQWLPVITHIVLDVLSTVVPLESLPNYGIGVFGLVGPSIKNSTFPERQ